MVELPVRMAEHRRGGEREGDWYGPTLNLNARSWTGTGADPLLDRDAALRRQ